MLFSDVIKHMLSKSVHVHCLNLLKFVNVFDDETALENAKLTIFELQQLQIFFVPSQPWWGQIKKFFSRKFPGILQKQ